MLRCLTEPVTVRAWGVFLSWREKGGALFIGGGTFLWDGVMLVILGADDKITPSGKFFETFPLHFEFFPVMFILACAVATSSLPGRYDLREGAPSEPFGPIRSAQVSAKRSPRGGRLTNTLPQYSGKVARHSDLRSAAVCVPMFLSHGSGAELTDPPTKFADFKLADGNWQLRGSSRNPGACIGSVFQPAFFRPFWLCSSSCVFVHFLILLRKPRPRISEGGAFLYSVEDAYGPFLFRGVQVGVGFQGDLHVGVAQPAGDFLYVDPGVTQ